MAHRIEVVSTIPDTRAKVQLRKLHDIGFPEISDVRIVDVYTVDAAQIEGEVRRSDAEVLTTHLHLDPGRTIPFVGYTN